MRINFTESFAAEPQDAEAAWRVIRRIVEARMAEEIGRLLEAKRKDKTA